jgi:hypothetical protein
MNSALEGHQKRHLGLAPGVIVPIVLGGAVAWSWRKAERREAQLHNDLGLALAEEGGLDRAIVEFQKALALWPNYEAALVNLGAARARKGQIP